MSIISKVLYRINIAGGIIVEHKFNFRSIKSVEQYKNQVPLGEYKDYESYILRMVN